MMKHRLYALISMVLVLCMGTPATIHAQEGTGQRIGEQFDEAMKQFRKEAKEVAGQLREGFEKVRASVDRMTVEGRVYARLHWDKTLNGASISVDVDQNGLTTLHGTVGSEADKTKAEELARDTVGVERVVNSLQVASAPEAQKPDAKR
ncbi:MAG: BON domain-containing protein [Thermoguttaceae bacterium]|jgi:osmotically-inducible protein OsmY